jgi:hypothetical protein
MAGYFHLASGSIECRLKKAPQIHVAASDTSVRYDHSKSQRQLDTLETDTVSPYGASVQTHVGGLMAGEVSISQNIRILQESWEHLNAGCLYVDSIRVDIHIKPVIYIANQYPKDGCMYQAIMEHEKKHIEVDRRIVNKYTKIIIAGLDKAFKKLGYMQGPFRIAELKQKQEMMQQYSQDIVRHYSSEMSAERRELQQEVDNIQEYERVQSLCRGKR